jgi:hypothetical protein
VERCVVPRAVREWFESISQPIIDAEEIASDGKRTKKQFWTAVRRKFTNVDGAKHLMTQSEQIKAKALSLTRMEHALAAATKREEATKRPPRKSLNPRINAKKVNQLVHFFMNKLTN